MTANIENGFSRSSICFGVGTCETIRENNSDKSFLGPSKLVSAHPDLPEAYMIGKSNCSSFAPKLANKSKQSFNARSGSPSDLSTLFTTTIGQSPIANALAVTNLV